MSFKPGFIAPPWPHTPGDSVNAESLIQRIEKEAHHGCGLHYEIYQYRALCKLRDLLTNLSAGDAEIFQQVAARRGFHLNESAMHETRKAYHETMDEIRREQE
ncbi:hypothetical protein QC837_004556 [Salmonella enterica]|uniref:hypothetical protein n=1 Tax=Salmonella enterica TaxID=28901 RepID=UPI0009B0A885|nr:hypothetical protein [Salmonella enterica]EKS9266615.1 hypothetical protein [Salmonella enterica]